MGHDALFLGVDLGTSGARTVVIDEAGEVRAGAKSTFADEVSRKSPDAWWRVVRQSMVLALADVDASAVRAASVSATSGTVLGLDADDRPLPLQRSMSGRARSFPNCGFRD